MPAAARPNPTPRGRPRLDSRRLWICRAVLLLVGAAAFANGMAGVFVFDDHAHIVRRADVLAGPVSAALEQDRRPVVTLTLMANYALGGLNPAGYHALNMLIHLLAGLVLFEVVRGSLELVRRRDAAWPVALAASLIWLVHPLQTESVTYTIQRAESLAGLCLFVVLLGLLRMQQGRNAWTWGVIAVASSIMGMGSKATMIAGPPVAFLFDALVLAPSFRIALHRRWGVHASLFLTSAVLVATGVVGAIFQAPEGARVGAGFAVRTVTSMEYLAAQPGVILHYLRLAFWPSALCIDWYWPARTPIATTVLAGMALILMIAAALWAAWRRHPLAFPTLAFFLWLAPTSSIVPLRDLAVEHRMYVPLAALAVIAAAAGARIMRPGARRAGPVVLALVVTALGVRTIVRNGDYTSRIALWSSTLDVVPQNVRARMNLGVALLDAGRVDEAVVQLGAVVAQQPSNATAQFNYGLALLESGAAGEAVTPLALAAGVLPQPRIDRALGEALRRSGRAGEAFEAYARAHAEDPRVESALALAALAEALGDHAVARRHHDEAVSYAADTGNASLAAAALVELGDYHQRRQAWDDAIMVYERAQRTDPQVEGVSDRLEAARASRDAS
jgi:Flp pilus assembly protein TadD